jgi:hypothetical protein
MASNLIAFGTGAKQFNSKQLSCVQAVTNPVQQLVRVEGFFSSQLFGQVTTVYGFGHVS